MNESNLKKANKFFRMGEYGKALTEYNKIVKDNKELAWIARENISIINRKNKPLENHETSVSTTKFTKTPPIKEDEPTFVGIASIPQREKSLKKTIDSIIHQVDKIGVFLDKYDRTPEFLKNNPKITFKHSGDFDREIGDAGKFYWVDNHEGFYFTCDDDLIYPIDYVERIKKRITSNDYPIVVGWHGSVILTPFENYYDGKSRRVFTFGAPRPYDTPVHILGTGCLGFHTSHIDVSFNDFETPNMADVYFSRLGQIQKVPFIVIKHSKGEITEDDNSQEYSIYKHSSQEVSQSKHNTKEKQNEIVSSVKWKKSYSKTYLNILIVGRFEINQKGGVYKSSHLLKEYLERLGHNVETCCLSKIGKSLSRKYDFSIIYAPDPERPDFGDCLSFVKKLADSNCVCAVNMSFNLNQKRSSWINKTLPELNSKYDKPRIFFASFSNSTQLCLDEKIKNLIIPFPKTIQLDRRANKSYHEREGIFLGDLAKLSNNNLVHGNIAKWVEQIRVQLPHVNIYALKHYHTEKQPLNYLKIIPYNENIGEILNKFRLAVCLVPGATFEMIPVESMIAGTPVIHRSMPQSLSEYLSPVSVQVETPEELGEICRQLYERQDIWERISDAGYSSNRFFNIENISANIDLAIRKAISRSGI